MRDTFDGYDRDGWLADQDDFAPDQLDCHVERAITEFESATEGMRNATARMESFMNHLALQDDETLSGLHVKIASLESRVASLSITKDCAFGFALCALIITLLI